MERAYGLTKNIYNKNCTSWNAKIRHYNTVVKTECLYASECLSMNYNPVSYTHLDVYKRQVYTQTAGQTCVRKMVCLGFIHHGLDSRSIQCDLVMVLFGQYNGLCKICWTQSASTRAVSPTHYSASHHCSCLNADGFLFGVVSCTQIAGRKPDASEKIMIFFSSSFFFFFIFIFFFFFFFCQ